MFKFLQLKINFKCFSPFSILWQILIPYHQMSIPCFLEDIDPIFNMFNFPAPGVSKMIKMFEFHNFEISKNTTFRKLLGILLELFAGSWRLRK